MQELHGSFRIRALRPADVEGIRRVLSACPEAGQWSPGEMGDSGGAGIVLLVAEAGEDPGTTDVDEGPGTPIGMLAARTVAGEAEILNLAVLPEWRRSGVAGSLLRAATGRILGSGGSMVFLEVRASNEGAQRFYERMGFRQTGLRRGYYRQPIEDALLFTRQLNE